MRQNNPTTYSVYQMIGEYVNLGYYEPTGKTPSIATRADFKFICFCQTAKEAARIAETLLTRNR